MNSTDLARCTGLGVLLLGVVVLVGWASGNAALTTVIPGLASMKANTALGFVLAGFALTLAPWTRRRAAPVARVCGLLVFAIGFLTSLEYLTGLDFAIDELFFSAPGNAHAHGSRMAIATSVGFVAAGAAELVLPRVSRTYHLHGVVDAASIAVAAIGLLGLVGYALDFELLYSSYTYGTVALHTAAGFVALGTGLWLAGVQSRRALADEATIARRATTLVVVAAAAIGIASLTGTVHQVKLVLAKGVDSTLSARSAQIRNALDLRSTRASVITTRPDLLRQLRLLSDNPRRSESRTRIRVEIESFAAHEFTAIVLTDRDGAELARFGKPIESPERELRVAMAARTSLLWQDGLHVRHELPLADAKGPLGFVLAEQFMPETTRGLVRSAEAFGATSELLLCGPGPLGFDCLPTRLTPKPSTLVAGSDDLASFAQRALEGQQGFATGTNQQGRRVFAGYAPLAALGLVALLTVESAEIYLPLGRQFELVLLLVAGISLAGHFLVRRWVRPQVASLEHLVHARTAELADANVQAFRNERRFRATIEAAPTAMVMIDAAGAIVLVNAQTEKLFEYAREELLGQPVEILIPKRLRDAHPGMRGGFFASPHARQMGAGRDLYGLRKNGSEVPVEIGLSPVETEEGLLVLSAIVDISERKRTEQRFRATIESAPTAMVMIDAAGAVVLVNAQTERLFGYARTELLGRPVEILLPERFRGAHPGMRSAFFGTPHARQMGAGRDLYGLCKDGSEIPVEIGLSPVETEDGLLVLSAIVDISERLRQIAAVDRANEVLESNIELQRFAYVVSHDLQTPMRSIASFVELLRSTYADKLDAQANDWIRRTVESIKYLQTLIRDLLEYSRADALARPFERVPFPAVFEHAVSLLDASIRDSGAEVTCGELPIVIGDRSQLVQLLLNLIGNGLKYHGTDPPRVHVSAKRNDTGWTFSVRDNGIGIAKRHHERIFGIFKRLHDQKEYPGTGIGLAVCRRVVHHHGGRIWVESDGCSGSVFHFALAEGTVNTQ